MSNKELIKHDDIPFLSYPEAGRSFHDPNMVVLAQVGGWLVGKTGEAESDVVCWVSSIWLSCYDITVV